LLRKTFQHLQVFDQAETAAFSQGVKADEEGECPDVELDMNIVDVAEREVQRRELYRRQMGSLAQTNKELRSKIAGKLKPTVRKSFLERIELRNQIPVTLPPTELQFDESLAGPCGTTY
jgi:hypothetical protein